MMKNLFTQFDNCCQQCKVFKLYTIGDCYVVLGLIDNNNRKPVEEARNVVQMGFSMIEVIKEVRKKIDFEQLDMRIGVHTVLSLYRTYLKGSYIGAIIGTDVVRYDIYGVDVLIANIMESNGERGRVMVSEVTRNYLSDFSDLQFTEREADVKCEYVVQKTIKAFYVDQLASNQAGAEEETARHAGAASQPID